jgi:hypothetical protein
MNEHASPKRPALVKKGGGGTHTFIDVDASLTAGPETEYKTCRGFAHRNWQLKSHARVRYTRKAKLSPSVVSFSIQSELSPTWTCCSELSRRGACAAGNPRLRGRAGTNFSPSEGSRVKLLPLQQGHHKLLGEILSSGMTQRRTFRRGSLASENFSPMRHA